ncbi:hypothetical protein KR054_005543, partial [Drosophila jambulina]
SSSGSSNILRLDLDQRQRPMRGISIIIESAASEALGTTATAAAAASPAAAAASPAAAAATMSSSNNSNAEMPLKSQAGMLLAFGDTGNTNTTATQAAAASAATKDNLETSYDTAATYTDTETTSTNTTTKIYPQLLLRIGESEDNGEITSTAAATSAATPATTSTIISCNVLPAAAGAAAAATTLGEIADSDIVVVASQPAASAASAASAAASPSNSAVTEHTVKIQIESQSQGRNLGKQISVVKLNEGEEMVFHQQQHLQQQQPSHLQFLVSSGQYSPCETLDSGTGSDLESVTKSPEMGGNTGTGQVPKLELHLTTNRLKVSEVSSPLRAYSLTDSSEECDESSSSSLSCDSLHSGGLLPSSLLRDIHSHRQQARDIAPAISTKIDGRPLQYEADRFYNFHVNEHENFRSFGSTSSASSTPEYEANNGGFQEEALQDDDAFVGYRDVRVLGSSGKSSANSTIRSAKGTVRGVKNRVRNGVATFLQLQQPNVKNYLEKDMGKVVLYTTSMGIIRETYAKCANVKQILRTLLIKFEERDVFMSLEYQQEMRERMHDEAISVPQLFVEGQHIGDADTVERLNESGELRQMLKPYKSIATAYTCQMCGGYRLLPCPSCSGSKKSVHRNHFTAEFVALKCMNCDEVGLVKCPNC